MIDFIDTFSGIGLFRLGLERVGGFRCVWSCDNNKYANQIYTRNFGSEGHYPGDIEGVDPREIPDFDFFCGGFPCQSFSVAGKRKGFTDTRGTLFFEICRIAAAKRPKRILLENVKGLLSHDEGLTFQIILESLEELGYWVEWQVLNSKYFGVPQNRERVFIIGHLREGSPRPIFPVGQVHENHNQRTESEARGQIGATLSGRSAGGQNARGNYVLKPREISTALDANYWKGPDKHDARTVIIDYLNRNIKEDDTFNTLKTNPSPSSSPVIIHRGYETMEGKPRIYEDICPTIPTPAGGGHIPEVVIPELANTLDTSGWLREMGRHEEGKHGLTDYRIRRLTPLECERLQGAPEGWTKWGYKKGNLIEFEDIYGEKIVQTDELDYYGEPKERTVWAVIGRRKLDTPIKDTIQISDTQRYRVLGNAVTVNVIEFLGELIKSSFTNKDAV